MPDTPTIPEPYATVPSLQATASALKESVEMLNGQRGNQNNIAVTWGDLLALGLIKQEQIPRAYRPDRLR